MRLARTLVVVAVVAMCGWRVFAQAGLAPTNDLPNPYQTGVNSFKLPRHAFAPAKRSMEAENETFLSSSK